MTGRNLMSNGDMFAICTTPRASARYRQSVGKDRYYSYYIRRMHLMAVEIKDMDYYLGKLVREETSNNLPQVKYEATWAVEASAHLASG